MSGLKTNCYWKVVWYVAALLLRLIKHKRYKLLDFLNELLRYG